VVGLPSFVLTGGDKGNHYNGPIRRHGRKAERNCSGGASGDEPSWRWRPKSSNCCRLAVSVPF
jgi:hypothetical protein